MGHKFVAEVEGWLLIEVKIEAKICRVGSYNNVVGEVEGWLLIEVKIEAKISRVGSYNNVVGCLPSDHHTEVSLYMHTL